MTYILEAMRRAESDRHRGEVPLLNKPSVVAAEVSLAEPPTSRLGLLWSAAIGLTIGFAGYALLRHFVFSTPPPPPRVATPPAAGVGAGGALPAQSWGGNGQVGGAGANREEAVSRPVAPDTRAVTAPPPVGPVPSQRTSPPVSIDSKSAPSSAKPRASGEGEPASRSKPAPAAAPSRAQPRAGAEASPAAVPEPAKTAVPVSPPSRRQAAAAQGAPAPSASSQAETVSASAPATPPAAAPAATPVPSALPRVRDLPPDLQREVPPLLVSGWVQSADPGSRQLLVNGVLLREGDALTPVLRLEMIGRRTAVFSVRGQRFEVPISL